VTESAMVLRAGLPLQDMEFIHSIPLAFTASAF